MHYILFRFYLSQTLKKIPTFFSSRSAFEENQVTAEPQKLINFYLDGILEIFLSLDNSKKQTLAATINRIISNLDEIQKRRLLLILPENAKKQLGF